MARTLHDHVRVYRCDLCNRIAGPGTPARHLITSTRRAEYTPRRKVQRLRDQKRIKLVDDPGGEGV
jgi:hypothetical protein